MTIAAHIESSTYSASYLAELMIGLAEQQPMHAFIIFASKQTSHSFTFPANCRLVTIKPVIRNSLLLHYWYHYKLPQLLEQFKATVFISENNVCSLRTTLPQIMLVHELPTQAQNFPLKNEFRFYHKRFFSKFAAKVNAVCATRHPIEMELLKQYPVLQGKITTVLHGLDTGYATLVGEKRDKVLAEYSGDHEYFICDCSMFTQQNLVSVLKAFSIFKKRLKSGMRLLVLNRLPEIPVRDEVQFISNFTREEEQRLIGAAYAAVHLPSFAEPGNFGLHCLQSAVPLVCSEGHGFENIYETAALYVKAEEKEIAECLMTLYKDETFRAGLVNKGTALAANYNRSESSNKLWQTISNYIPV